MMNTSVPTPATFDLTPYAGRWIALIRDRVAGVGRTAQEAASLAKTARPKEEPIVLFVPIDFGHGQTTS